MKKFHVLQPAIDQFDVKKSLSDISYTEIIVFIGFFKNNNIAGGERLLNILKYLIGEIYIDPLPTIYNHLNEFFFKKTVVNYELFYIQYKKKQVHKIWNYYLNKLSDFLDYPKKRNFKEVENLKSKVFTLEKLYKNYESRESEIKKSFKKTEISEKKSEQSIGAAESFILSTDGIPIEHVNQFENDGLTAF